MGTIPSAPSGDRRNDPAKPVSPRQHQSVSSGSSYVTCHLDVFLLPRKQRGGTRGSVIGMAASSTGLHSSGAVLQAHI